MTQKQYEEIAAIWGSLYLRGASLEELAILSGATPPTVARYLRRHGIALRRTGPRNTKSEERTKLILYAYKKYQSGSTLALE